MWTTAIALLTWLFTNSDEITKAGQSVINLGRQIIEMITGAKAQGRTDITYEEFNHIVDQALGSSADLDQMIADLKAEIAAGSG